MDSVSVAYLTWTLVRVTFDIADLYARHLVRGIRLFRLRDPSGIALLLFGNRTTWRIQAQILGQMKDGDALEFKASVYNEYTMIAVAASCLSRPSMKFQLKGDRLEF
jgi:hypothetical protein